MFLKSSDPEYNFAKMVDVLLPSSKSVSLRALVLNFLTGEKTKLSNLSDCDDVRYLREALEKLENPPQSLLNRGEDLFIGESGATARFVAALSLTGKSFVLKGGDRLCERPMEDLFEALQNLGVKIEYLGEKGLLPARFTSPQNVLENRVQISGTFSSQFTSALLLVAPALPSGLTIEITSEILSQPYIEMTLKMLKLWGASIDISSDFRIFKVAPGFHPPAEFRVPADCTSASYPVAYALLTRQPIRLNNYGSETLQGDEAFLNVAEKFGARVSRSDQGVEIHPPKALNALGTIDFGETPDIAMTAMGVAALADGESHFTGLSTLRHKESDRIQAMQEGLQKLGVKVETGDDWMRIWGASREILNQVQDDKVKKVNSQNDHRIAMIFGVLSKSLGLNVGILNPECVSKSWPGFWLELADWAGELRSVAATIVQDRDRYLIVKKTRKHHAWQFPQGGVEGDELLLQAAKRELHEECGDIKVEFSDQPIGEYKYLFPSDFSRHDENIRGAHVTFFKAQFLSGEVVLDPEELEDFKWVTEKKLPEYFDREYWEAIKRMI